MPSTTADRASTDYFPRLAAERPDIALCRASAAAARAADAQAGALGLGVGSIWVKSRLRSAPLAAHSE